VGDIACFSTYIAHLLTTGVGGLAVTNDPELAVKLRSLVNHGRDSIYISIDDDKNKKKNELSEVIKRRFSFVDLGYSYRLTEFEGALGLAGLARYKEDLRLRKRNAALLQSGLSKFKKYIQLPTIPLGAEHAFMMFPIVVIDKRISADELVNWLEEYRVETRSLLPLLNQPIYKKIFGDIESRYPVARFVRENGFYIGCHTQLRSSDIKYIVSVFVKFFEDKKFA
jgi:dTDP-4-amino-4,6-dideoxygalactose transaminase